VSRSEIEFGGNHCTALLYEATPAIITYESVDDENLFRGDWSEQVLIDL
jgi:hypothetical protein